MFRAYLSRIKQWPYQPAATHPRAHRSRRFLSVISNLTESLGDKRDVTSAGSSPVPLVELEQRGTDRYEIDTGRLICVT